MWDRHKARQPFRLLPLPVVDSTKRRSTTLTVPKAILCSAQYPCATDDPLIFYSEVNLTYAKWQIKDYVKELGQQN